MSDYKFVEDFVRELETRIEKRLLEKLEQKFLNNQIFNVKEMVEEKVEEVEVKEEQVVEEKVEEVVEEKVEEVVEEKVEVKEDEITDLNDIIKQQEVEEKPKEKKKRVIKEKKEVILCSMKRGDGLPCTFKFKEYVNGNPVCGKHLKAAERENSEIKKKIEKKVKSNETKEFPANSDEVVPSVIVKEEDVEEKKEFISFGENLPPPIEEKSMLPPRRKHVSVSPDTNDPNVSMLPPRGKDISISSVTDSLIDEDIVKELGIMLETIA